MENAYRQMQMNAQAEKVAKISLQTAAIHNKNLKHKTAALGCRFFILLVVKLKRFSHYRSIKYGSL